VCTNQEKKEMQTKRTSVTEGPADELAPKKLTLAENAILTLKVLGVLLLLGAGIWGLNVWNSAK
jgi:hypothetical protein